MTIAAIWQPRRHAVSEQEVEAGEDGNEVPKMNATPLGSMTGFPVRKQERKDAKNYKECEVLPFTFGCLYDGPLLIVSLIKLKQRYEMSAGLEDAFPLISCKTM